MIHKKGEGIIHMKINWFHRSNDPTQELCVYERVAYASCNTGIVWSYILIGSFLTFYYTNIVGLDPAIIGSIILGSKLLDGFSDLLMGVVVDKTHTKMGKARPWILFMALPHAIATVLAFSVPGSLAQAHQYIYVFATYNLVNSVTYTMISVPMFAQNVLNTTNSQERAKSGIWMQIGANLVILLVNATCVKFVDMLGGTGAAWRIVSACYAAAGAAMMVFSALNTRERVVPAPEEYKIPIKKRLLAVVQNKYWWVYTIANVFITTSTSIGNAGCLYYCNDVLGSKGSFATLSNAKSMVALFVLTFMMGWLIKKLGVMLTRSLCYVFNIIGCIGMYFATGSMVALIFYSVMGIAWACLLGAQGALLADTCEYGGRRAGFDVSGVTNASQSFVSKVSQGLGSAILGYTLSYFGYNGMAAVQTERAVFGVRIAFCIVPLLLYIISAIIFSQFDLYKKGYLNNKALQD